MLSKNLKTFACAVLALTAVSLTAKNGFAFEDQERKVQSLVNYTLGVVHDLRGETEEAIKKFEKSAEYDDNYAAHLRLGADYARLDRLDDAIRELNIVLKYDANNIQARYLLALIYSTQKEFDKAAKQYESILTSFSEAEPENIEIYGYLAQLYYSQKQYKKAIEQFEIILALEPENTEVMFLLGSLYLEEGRQQDAIDVFLRAVLVDPQNHAALNSLGYVYAEAGIKLDEAQELIEKALELDPGNAAYLDSLGWVFYKKGMYEQAIGYLKQADSTLKDPVIYDHLGDVYFKIDNKEDAKKYWKLSLELLPDQKSVKKKLKSVK